MRKYDAILERLNIQPGDTVMASLVPFLRCSRSVVAGERWLFVPRSATTVNGPA